MTAATDQVSKGSIPAEGDHPLTQADDFRESQWGTDPFYHRKGRSPVPANTSTVPSTKVERAALRLLGIMYREQGAKALIDGRIVAVGDTISGHLITEIAPDRVTVAQNNRTTVLKVRRESP
jgi:hypothetical protein